MVKRLDQLFLDELWSPAVSKKNIVGAVLCVESGDGTVSLLSEAGNLSASQSYFIASVTKLYVTAILLKLKDTNRLQLEDKISTYLSDYTLNQLHVINDIDYSKEITIKHLMSNTSGIPDYFSRNLISELTAGMDQKWGFDRTIAYAKQQKPKFPPGKRAHYSDTNYQLLGKIIELVTEKDIQTVFKEFIFDELGLKETYLYEDMNDPRPALLYVKEKALHLPMYMSSIGPEGGIVSTARESMIFLKAFIKGHLFPITYFDELKEWKLLFGPGLFYYGVGIASQPVSIFELKDGLIGHWGQSGSFAFYHPKTDLYFTGTVNQFYGHGIAAKKIIKIIKSYKNNRKEEFI